MKKALITLFAAASTYANAQILINEYSGSNISQHTDNFGNFSDWFELYNTTAGPIDLTGYYLSDNISKPTKFQIPTGAIIPANGFIKVYCNGMNQIAGGNIHANFKLTQTKPEDIVIASPGGTIINQLTIVPTQPNHSRGRTVDGGATWSLFLNPSQGASNSTKPAYNNYTSKPAFNYFPGSYTTALSITLSGDPGATIYYTTNGSTPTTFSTIYTVPINIGSTTVIRAMAINSDTMKPPSFVETNTYLINENHLIPVTSICGDNIMTLMTGTISTPTTTLEFFDKTGTFKTEVSGTSNEHGNDSWAYGQRGIDFVSEDRYGINYGLTTKVFARKSRKEFQRIILKAAANDNYSFEAGGAHIRDAYVHTLSHDAHLNLDERTYEPTILYVNGQYWGVYDIREKVDDNDFTDYYYHQDDPYLYFLQTWGGTWEAYTPTPGAAIGDWNALLGFVNSNSLTIPANYNYVDSLFSTKSLTDYFILNSYCVTSDWLNWNTAWWRGLDTAGQKKKWRYTLWDMDATFGHYINYTGIPSQSSGADPCNAEALPDPGGQGHTVILDSLLQNPQFHTDYINRYIDLSNSALSCDNMVHLLDSLINNIKVEMPRQCSRWGGTYAGWQTNVNTMRNFIIQRCDSIVDGLMGCYNLTGPYNITFETDPIDIGTISVNTLNLSPAQLPFTGTYYGNILTDLKTAPVNPDYEFDYWEVVDYVSPTTDSSDVSLTFGTSQNVIAHYKIPTTIFIPTAFSPNGDGVNDDFKVLGKGIKSVNLDIYDRWGEKIFSTTDKDQGWDGTYRNQKCFPAVFAYRAYVKYIDGTEKVEKGNVTLIR